MAEKPEQGRLEELKRSLTNALPSLSPEQVERAAVAALSVPAFDQEVQVHIDRGPLVVPPDHAERVALEVMAEHAGRTFSPDRDGAVEMAREIGERLGQPVHDQQLEDRDDDSDLRVGGPFGA